MSLLSTELNKIKTENWLKAEKIRLEGFLTSEEWKKEFQGKLIFARLCGEVLKSDAIRIRECYIDIALNEKPEILNDIIEIFKKM